jgi:hypothetical protein
VLDIVKHWLQIAAEQLAEHQVLLRQAPPPQPRRRSHAGAHYPRHATNAKNYFPFKSGCGPRECARRTRQAGVDWLNA